MRETPLSSCERQFIETAVAGKFRIDGREAFDYRKIKITFGIERGCCQVELGQTRVLAQVSCHVVEPKPVRPSDGCLFVNVELSPMASASFEPGRPSDFAVEINRLLERCLKESRCLDTESLCIVSGDKVWEVRIDVTILNHAGNLIDASSIAAITALAHFRRPDVTVSGDVVTIHPIEEKDPIPLSVHHMPICVSFAFYEQGKYLLVDPVEIEEKVMDGRMVIGMNKHREICTLQITGRMLLLKDQVLRCSNIAVVKVAETTELIHRALENDRQARASGGKFGFAESVLTDKVTAHVLEGETVTEVTTKEDEDDMSDQPDDSDSAMDSEDSTGVSQQDKPTIMGKGVAGIGLGGASSWEVDEAMKDLAQATPADTTTTSPSKRTHADGDLGGDSEEDEVQILQSDMTTSAKSKSTGGLSTLVAKKKKKAKIKK